MSLDATKVQADHLRRDAYLYVRQSTLRQVMEHTESTQRQYGLRQRAVALGWPADRVIVIDEDQGQSASGTVDRAGFQRLVGDVGVGRAGIVLGLEVSRLARSSTEWHRLLEICALTNTLILDEDGVYDPAHFNDRLLLGLKGTMSEAELHVLRARLRGGVQSKARRGELKMPLPTGLVYDATDRVVRDPERRVQATLRLFFRTFRRPARPWPRSSTSGTTGFSSHPTPGRRPQGRGRLRATGAQPRAPHPAQPSLRRCVRLRSHPHPSSPGGWTAAHDRSSKRMAGAHPRRS